MTACSISQRWKEEIAERPAVQKSIAILESRDPSPERDEQAAGAARKVLA